MIKNQDTFTPLTEGIQQGSSHQGQEPGSVGNTKKLTFPQPIDGFQLFSLGPLYVYGGVDRDLIAEFQRESAEFQSLTLEYENSVFFGLAEWNNILQAIPVEIFEYFKTFLFNYLLLNTPKKEYFEIQGLNCPFLHSLEICSSKKIGVFVPSGNHFRVIVKVTQNVLEVVKTLPDPKIIQKAKAYFRLGL